MPQNRLSTRQMEILQFLAIVTAADEGDVAYAVTVQPWEIINVPDQEIPPAQWIVRRELQFLESRGLVKFDGILWRLTPQGRIALNTWAVNGEE
ncbi:MAG: hypothetical protein H0Z39_03675 [Peptococcaceae bacterium]|nr:hypothetical protein [Peptococcaceae bacterium]